MQKRRLGDQSPEVSAIGLGCEGMSEFYGARDDDESVSTIHPALDVAINLLHSIEAIFPPGAAAGTHCTAPMMALPNG